MKDLSKYLIVVILSVNLYIYRFTPILDSDATANNF